MGGHSKRSCSDEIRPVPPIPPVPDLIVTGVLTPDATGNYFLDGVFNGQNSFKRTDGNYFIWYENTTGTYYLSLVKGLPINPPYWYNENTLLGVYEDGDETIGEATIAVGS